MWPDIKQGWRFLASKPLFTFAVVATLAVGIGVNSAMYAIAYSVLWRPLPYDHPQQLVKISDVQGRDIFPFSFEEVQYLSSWPALLQAYAAYFPQTYTLISDNGAENVAALRASVNLLPLLGVRPVIGPGFSRNADSPSSERELIFSDRLWRKTYRADPTVIGKSVRLEDHDYTVVGVLPPTFHFMKGTALLVPLRLDRNSAPSTLHFLDVVGRIRGNSTPARMTPALKLPTNGSEVHGITVVGLQQEIVSGVRVPVLLLFGATSLILLIASTNVASLLIVRSITRRKELAVRMALGANSRQIARQLFAEAAALSLAGGTVGLLLAWAVLRWAHTSALSFVPRSEEVSLDGQVLLFTGLVSVVAAAFLNLGPAVQWRIKNLNEPLRSTRQSGLTKTARRWQNSLVAAEVALTVTLLCGTGLLIRSFNRVIRESEGFSSQRVFSIDCTLGSQYKNARQIESFYNEARQRIAALPGVESVGMVNSLPLTGAASGGVELFGSSQIAKTEYTANKILADGGYFSTLRIPLVTGRLFDRTDTAQSPQVAIVDQTFARQVCGKNLSACLGRMIHFGWGRQGLSQVVGVVGPVRQDDLETRPKATVYVPVSQNAELLETSGLTLVARTPLEPENAAAGFRSAILAIDRFQPPPNVQRMTKLLDSSIVARKLILTLLSVLASLAVLLSMLGVYATMSYVVEMRAPEFVLRVALGAQRSDVLSLILRHTATLAATGLGLGFLGAIATTRFISSILYRTSPFDPLTFATVALATLLLVFVAAWLPAKTALALDPASALKCE